MPEWVFGSVDGYCKQFIVQGVRKQYFQGIHITIGEIIQQYIEIVGHVDLLNLCSWEVFACVDHLNLMIGVFDVLLQGHYEVPILCFWSFNQCAINEDLDCALSLVWGSDGHAIVMADIDYFRNLDYYIGYREVECPVERLIVAVAIINHPEGVISQRQCWERIVLPVKHRPCCGSVEQLIINVEFHSAVGGSRKDHQRHVRVIV